MGTNYHRGGYARWGGGKVAGQVVEGGGDSPNRVPRQDNRREGGLAGGGPYPKMVRVLLWHRTRGGDLEGGGGDSQPPLHRRYHLPRLPPRIPDGSRYGDRQPQGQSASAGCGLEGGGSPCNIPRPAQGLQLLGKFHMPGYPGGTLHGYQGPLPPLKLLGEA